MGSEGPAPDAPYSPSSAPESPLDVEMGGFFNGDRRQRPARPPSTLVRPALTRLGRPGQRIICAAGNLRAKAAIPPQRSQLTPFQRCASAGIFCFS